MALSYLVRKSLTLKVFGQRWDDFCTIAVPLRGFGYFLFHKIKVKNLNLAF